MKRIAQKFKNLFAIALILIFCGVCVTTAWATLSFLKPDGISLQTKKSSDVAVMESDQTPRSRAPEPSTMALLGSGMMGMILSFVRRTYTLAKRGLDIVASVIGLVLLSPLFLMTALLIKLTSRGPILYRQIRVGKDGEEFEMYKFRTMKVDAEKDSGPVWAAQNDSRLIPCGQFLRKAHIDEIPQFVNILKGDMSLIGPRPERPVFVQQFKEKISDYEKRLMVKPGLTGLAQVWHKYDETIEDVKKKIKYDILYIKRMCLWTDLRILLRTFRVVFTGEGAR